MGKEKENGIVAADSTPVSLIQMALDGKADVGVIERLVAMFNQQKEAAAKESYYGALAAFQMECPTISKNQSVESKGKHMYSYAPLDDIVSQVRELLKKHGFSYSVNTETKDGMVKSICKVHHRDGHSEEIQMEVPIVTGTQVMSEAQKVAASATFSKRYAFINAFGIMTGEDNNEQGMLQDPKVFQKDAIKEAEARLKLAKTDSELISAWSDLPAASKKEPSILKIKNDMKKKLAGPSELTDEDKKKIIEQETKEVEKI